MTDPKLPRYAIVQHRGKCRVLEQFDKDRFVVLTKQDVRVLVHRSRCTFTNR